ncbi:hypothetical protein ACSVIJ_04990 [Pseudomonas sp. NCHU5208]|uniref:hypothetical protein n=1 Tax=unclassified Pseudomonas TaxID=196821 RepID=UPI003F9C6878
MKARIEKKLSKKLVTLAPSVFKGVWIDSSEPSELAYKQRTSVSHVWSVGGGTDYFGEGMDAYTAWEWWRMNWEWHGDFPSYPEEHQHHGYPDVSGFHRTTRNLLKLAVRAEQHAQAEQERIRQSRLDFAARFPVIHSHAEKTESA